MRADLNRYEDPWTAEVYDYSSGRKGDDLAFWTQLAAESEGSISELACGTGRVALPLARAGFAVTGLDCSPNMLAIARRFLRATGFTSRGPWCYVRYLIACGASPREERSKQ